MLLVKELPQLLKRVSRPGRYIGGEFNEVQKDPREVDVRLALGFPDIYEIGMSHLGLKLLYHILNQRPDVWCERVFAPWHDMEELLRQEQLPLYTLESKSALCDMDIVGFTLQYEMTYTNILAMLDLGGIPLQGGDRSPSDPLIIAGGPGAFNPESLAPFFDVVVLGEGEEVIGELVDVYKEHAALERGVGWRQRLLQAWATIDGVYVPSGYTIAYNGDGTVKSIEPTTAQFPPVIRKRLVQDIASAPYPTDPVVPAMDVVHDRAMVEIFRGCGRGCRFCQAGTIYRPVRERPVEQVQSLARDILKHTGYDELSLVSLSSADHSCISPLVLSLLDEWEKEKVGISLPSLRVDTFSVGLAEQVQRVRKSGLTFAPEAGTQRLRNVINKGVTRDDLLTTTRAVFSAGWRLVKLYFMIGLPTEIEEDVEAIAELTYDVLHTYPRGKKGGKVNVSVAGFVPKPHTPFQWEAQDSVGMLESKQERLKQRFRTRRIDFSWHDAGLSVLEGAFSRGDRRLANVLLAAYRLGCRFDAWSDQVDLNKWEQAFEESGLDISFYAQRAREKDEVLPWSHLDSGVSQEFLWEERQRAYAGKHTPDCRHDVCSACGVCEGLNAGVVLCGQRSEP